MSGPGLKRNHGSNHHIGKIAQAMKVEKHVYRERRLCTGNAEYERKMAEAIAEFAEAEARAKSRLRPFGRR